MSLGMWFMAEAKIEKLLFNHVWDLYFMYPLFFYFNKSLTKLYSAKELEISPLNFKFISFCALIKLTYFTTFLFFVVMMYWCRYATCKCYIISFTIFSPFYWYSTIADYGYRFCTCRYFVQKHRSICFLSDFCYSSKGMCA